LNHSHSRDYGVYGCDPSLTFQWRMYISTRPRRLTCTMVNQGEKIRQIVPRCSTLASFPGCFHLQYLITYSMQIRREGRPGKFGHVWLRQKVDTQGVMPDEESRSPFCAIGQTAGGQSLSKAVSIPSVVHSDRDGLTRNGNYYCRAPPPVCLPSVYLT